MKPKNLLTILNILLSLSISFAQIGSKMNTGNLVGTWTNNDMGFAMTLLLQSDGTGEFDGEALTYVTKDNQLIISAGENSTIYHYKLTENTLTLSDGDLPSPVSFTRNGMTTSPAVTTAPTVGNTMPSADQSDVIGKWSGNGEEIEFAANGQCRYLGQNFPYTAQAGHITLTTGQGNVIFTYKVSGDQLTLSANGQNVTYSRGAGNAAPSNPASSQGRVAPELVGQWCWIDANSYNQGTSSSSRCITLNADGTYIYNSESSRSVNTPDYYGGTNAQNSDQGTWYVNGDRIYYNSQTTGQGSYRLEKRNHPKNVNDPMIVLDGEAYVTATQRPPWR
jgi:hypothetical protein